MANVFDTIITQGVRQGKIPSRTEEARRWFRETAKGTKRIAENKLLNSDKERLTNTPEIGSMYLFMYDPKHKDTLPYYDKLPLIFPIGKAEGGFYGINFHYLPLVLRAKLMDALYDIVNNDKYDTSTKIKLSYRVLKGASKYKYFKPCIKRYLIDHTRSQFMYIYPSEWDIAIFLPLARFEKRTAHRVHADSRRAITKEKSEPFYNI